MQGSKKKCRVLLCGGLGNQLFQYAFARCLSRRSHVDLELDVSTVFSVDATYQRTYELEAFILSPTAKIIRPNAFMGRVQKKIKGLRSRGKPLNHRSLLVEPRPVKFLPEYRSLLISKSVSLLGYWQCEKYFIENADLIREELSFRESCCVERERLADEITNSESVAVHVRQVQYTQKLDVGYYQKALKEMRERIPNAKFYLFSDAPDWWESEFGQISDVTHVSEAGVPAIEDFKLMSMCRHFIIANSSFSWWAAWLGSYPQKKVLAPPADCWSNPDSIPVDWEVVV